MSAYGPDAWLWVLAILSAVGALCAYCVHSAAQQIEHEDERAAEYLRGREDERTGR